MVTSITSLLPRLKRLSKRKNFQKRCLFCARLVCCMLTLINRSIQEEEEDEEEAPEFVAEDEIEESDLSDIEVHTYLSILLCILVPRHPDLFNF